MRFFIFTLLFTLPACGFHLREAYQYPTWFNSVAIINQTTNAVFSEKLQAELTAQNISMSENGITAIKIEHYQLTESVSKTTRNISVTLTLNIRYSVSNGKPLFTDSLRQQGHYEYARGSFSSDTQQKQRLKSQLLDAHIQAILLRISKS